MIAGYKKQLLVMVLPLLLLTVAAISRDAMASAGKPKGSNKQTLTLTQKVRHELIMLSDAGAFDDLSFSLVNTDTVVLSGQVVRPLLKADAETAVSRIKGVSKVINNIEVLPLSRSDDTIRARAYRAIYSTPDFEKYAIQAVPPIRIIVKNSAITLRGIVKDSIDKMKAKMAVKMIPGVFRVTDELTIE
jgi:hyperosmotically inducible periplasmic protein